MIRAEQLAEWERLADDATKGPWKQCGLDGVISMSNDADPIIASCCSIVPTQQSKDAAFIAAAREAVPELIAEVRELENEAEYLARMLSVIDAGRRDAAFWRRMAGNARKVVPSERN